MFKILRPNLTNIIFAPTKSLEKTPENYTLSRFI